MIIQIFHKLKIISSYKLRFFIAFDWYVEWNKPRKSSWPYNLSTLNFNVSYFHFHDKESWLFSFSLFSFGFLPCVLCVCVFACAWWWMDGSCELVERPNPHPPNHAWGCIYIDYPSLFFSKSTVTLSRCNKNKQNNRLEFKFLHVERKCYVTFCMSVTLNVTLNFSFWIDERDISVTFVLENYIFLIRISVTLNVTFYKLND